MNSTIFLYLHLLVEIQNIVAHNLIGWFEIILYWALLLQAALFITTLQTYLANLQFAEAQQVISKAYPYGVKITDIFEHETILSS